MDPYYNNHQASSYGSGYHPSTSSGFPAASSSSSAPVHRPANAYEYDVGAAAQQSAYVPGATVGRAGGSGSVVPKGGKRTTVLRKGAGKVWEDQTLLEWDSCK